MSERRKKSQSILLRAGGKITSVELFPSSEWPGKRGGEGLFRVRVNDVWHCPAGRYSFLTPAAVAELAAVLLHDGDPPKEDQEPYLPYKAEVRVSLDGAPGPARAWVHAPPHRESDGRWWVWIWMPGGPRKLPASAVTLVRVV
jgi:hypothetical protein